MKYLKFVIIPLFLGVLNLYGQNTGNGFGFVNFNTPNSAALGKLEQIPMNLFNGLPNIDIPLYTINNKSINVPISLNYSAGGIKPDDHPTWVGSGFSLNCGGSIIRIINGSKDEYNQDDFKRESNLLLTDSWFGNYYSSKILDIQTWDSEDGIKALIGNSQWDKIRDTEPDEFIINAPGISASFYFLRDKNDNITVKTKSKNGRYLKVEASFKNGLKVDFFNEKQEISVLSNPFFEFVVTTEDGIVYRFGGEVNTIDFYSGYGNSIGIMPTAWYLTEIVGKTKETVNFKYARSGNPLSYTNIKSSSITSMKGFDSGPFITSENNENLSINHPVYLKEIVSSNGLNINFIAHKTNELKSEIDGTVFGRLAPVTPLPVQYFRIDSLKSQNYWMKLDEIKIDNKISIGFTYRDTTTERLRLDAIKIKSNTNTQKYNFTYNKSKLPPYNAKLSDNWGYYNNKNYDKISYDEMYNFRRPDVELMKAGVLTHIVYPLGGSVEFQYEAHQYGKVISQFPDFKLTKSSGTSGGLRVRKILFYDKQDEPAKVIKEYKYELEDSTSSGILSGIPLYYSTGRSHVEYNFGGWDGLLKWRNKADYVQRFQMSSERNFNQLSTTNGNHVTYSRVIETDMDKGKTIYYYTNHEDFGDLPPVSIYTNMDNCTLSDPFMSRELERGLLKQVNIFNSNNKKVKTVEYKYNSSSDRYNDFVKSIVKIANPGIKDIPFIRYVINKIFTFYPYLEKETETTFDQLGLSPVVQEKNYSYYSTFNQLDSMWSTTSQNETKYVKNKYAFNFDNEVYKSMVSANKITDVVETVEGINGKPVLKKKTDFSFMNDKMPLPQNINVQYSSINTIDTLFKFMAYDSLGNILSLLNKKQASESFQWGYSSHYPVVVIKNANQEIFKKEEFYTEERQNIDADYGTLDFETTSVGEISIAFNQEPGMARFITFNLTGPVDKYASLMFYRLTAPISSPWSDWRNGGVPDRISYPNMPIGKYKITFQRPTKAGETYNPKISVRYQTKTIIESKDKDREFYYNGFEEIRTYVVPPFAGEGCYVGNFMVPFIIPNAKRYLIDYRFYKNGVWSTVCKEYKNKMMLIDGTAFDEIRIYPDNAQITTYTYDPKIGITSKTDTRGQTEYYEYDNMKRLIRILDMNKNLLKTFDYNFRNQ